MLTNKIIAYKTKGLIKKSTSLRQSMSYDQVKEIGILFSTASRDKHDLIKGFIKKFEADGKHVKALTFLPKNEENHEFMFDFFTEKELSFWGNFQSEKVTDFINTPFDYIFYIDIKSHLLLRNILAQCKAKCRIAKYDHLNAPIAEMMIHVPGKVDIKHLIEEMYRYTKKLS